MTIDHDRLESVFMPIIVALLVLGTIAILGMSENKSLSPCRCNCMLPIAEETK